MSEHRNLNKSIECSVCSCKFHDQRNYCSLNKIRVDAAPGHSSGRPEDESMCASYCCRGNC